MAAPFGTRRDLSCFAMYDAGPTDALQDCGFHGWNAGSPGGGGARERGYWHGRRKRGDASPAIEKSAGDVPPREMIPISVSFFLAHMKILHFPPFSK